ncbi:MAG: mechanosensitive ion channel, partial [Planctomycetales bacterium]|nr:mechanosensitive ion channel [Planctomycetales bacterium]
VWSWVALAAPLSFAGLTIAGYYYTAQQLTWRLNASLVFLFVLLLAQAFLKRLLLVRRRAISIQQARERAIAREQAGEAGESSPQPDSPPDVAVNTEQTKRLIRTSLVAASMVGLWLIWVDVLPALRILDQYPLWSVDQPWAMAATDGDGAITTAQSLGGEAVASVSQPAAPTRIGMRPKQVTIADLGLAVVIAMLTFASARNIPGVMEISILQRLPLDPSIRYAVTTLTRYSIVLLGMIFAFKAISIGWSTVQWLATALTFGLAFGVQEIFANFVAGLILLFERPLRVGDVVTVDEVTGVVSRIRIRATTITDWDRKEYVIPNKEFITGRMLNWTLSDRTNRIVVQVGIAYGSDVAKAKRLLMEICQAHEAILDDPAPVVTFEQFGDSTLNLVVRAYLPEIDRRLPTIDDLHMEIDRQFRLEGIEIAFPQHDLHLRTVDANAVSALQVIARGQENSGA